MRCIIYQLSAFLIMGQMMFTGPLPGAYGSTSLETQDELPLQRTINLTASATLNDANISHASAQLVVFHQDLSIVQAKALPDDTLVTIDDVTVSAGTVDFNGRFYVQEENRISGIGVLWNSDIAAGGTVTINGKMSTIFGERMIDAQGVEVVIK